ncbi:hypothetical protein [Nitrospina watsonii]|uniref:Uncharacterized protein n=1 Tax=Nitrospina watsonii TaxID=1323948 RepID=A0ABM9HEL6_9BACT|nr:hypothetical protein [Nitrospina watsonii]CAI2718678.1 conserved protein of unknown function [Nitrospina watsonii]
MMNDETTSPTGSTNDASAKKKTPDSEASKKQEPEKEKGKGVEDVLKSARRRGIAQKGQQGVIEFDYPRKKE